MHRVVAIGFALLTALAVAGSSAIDANELEGRPEFADGTDLGYFIWRDDGDRWHVRWTTRGQQHRFSGAVTATGGDLKSLKRIDVEQESRIVGRTPTRVAVGPRGRAHVVGGHAVVATRTEDRIDKEDDNRIVFVSRTTDEIDGFDFRVDGDVTELRFNLEIDGRWLPRQVVYGARNQNAEVLPLVVALGPEE
jgi:hypothetical protein